MGMPGPSSAEIGDNSVIKTNKIKNMKTGRF